MLDDLNVLAAFLAVADERSFTKAARRLGVSPSALSHSIRGLEERIGVRLLSRTTRSVAPTEPGEQLISHLRPALGDIVATLEQIAQLRDTPAGHVRLAVSPVAARVVLAPKLARFTRDYPNVVLDVTTMAVPRVDLVAGGFDAGIRLGEFIERDMIAVRVSAISARRSSARRGTSSRTRRRSRRTTSRTIPASTSGRVPKACIAGSSTRAISRSPSPSAARSSPRTPS